MSKIVMQPPPLEVHLTGTFPVQDVTKNLDRIADALESITKTLDSIRANGIDQKHGTYTEGGDK